MSSRAALASFVATALIAAPLSADAVTDLWTLAPSDAPRAAGVVQAATVHADVERLAALRVGDAIELPLPTEAVPTPVRHTAIVTRIQPLGHDRTIVIGTIGAGGTGTFAMARYGTGLAASLHLPTGETFRMRGARDGSIQLERVDPAAVPWCAGGAEAMPAGVAREVAPTGVPPIDGCDDGTYVDVLVPFTPEAREAAGGMDNMRAEIDLMIANMNAALEASSVVTRARLVYARELEPGLDDIGLSSLTNDGDGTADGVHALRDAFTADQVAMVVSGGGGVANGLWNLDPDSEALAFCINGRDSMPYIIAHEVGHNLGCCHARGDGGGCPGEGGLLYPYSNGHRFTGESGTLWRSVMAYSPGTWSAFYSNPDVLFDGVATGVPEGEADSADNARTINLAAPTVATWRCSDPVCFDLDLPPDAPDCNENDVPDLCEIARGELEDVNGDGIPDICQCAGDVDESGYVDVADLLGVLAAWGPCPDCAADLDGDDMVAVSDLLIVLAHWGVCP